MDEGEERASSRDIVLCLDVSGSALPYDREVIDTYRTLVDNFKGERIGLSIFNSTSRTVFPLTDDYELVSEQLDKTSTILKGVESQDDIDKMKDSDYQAISDWLEGTQNRKEAHFPDRRRRGELRSHAARFRLRQFQRRDRIPSTCRFHCARHRQCRFRRSDIHASGGS